MEIEYWKMQCFKCKHYGTGTMGPCPGFPDGIPTEILTGAFDHKKPHAGDHGYRFEEAPPRERVTQEGPKAPEEVG